MICLRKDGNAQAVVINKMSASYNLRNLCFVLFCLLFSSFFSVIVSLRCMANLYLIFLFKVNISVFHFFLFPPPSPLPPTPKETLLYPSYIRVTTARGQTREGVGMSPPPSFPPFTSLPPPLIPLSNPWAMAHCLNHRHFPSGKDERSFPKVCVLAAAARGAGAHATLRGGSGTRGQPCPLPDLPNAVREGERRGPGARR